MKGAISYLKELFGLYRLYGRMDLQWFLQDSRNSLILLTVDIVLGVADLAGLMLLAVRFQGVGGFSAREALFFLAFYETGNGFLTMLFSNYNVLNISRRVGRGQLDHMLIQPRPLAMQLLAEGFAPVSGCGKLLVGLTVLIVACVGLHMRITLVWLLMLILYVICYGALQIGQSYLWGSLAFYGPAAFEEISSVILDLNGAVGRYPLAGLPHWLTSGLCTVLPVGLTAYLPARVLLGKIQAPWQIALPFVVAAAFLWGAGVAFRRGMRRYLTHSCNRYRDMGFRN